MIWYILFILLWWTNTCNILAKKDNFLNIVYRSLRSDRLSVDQPCATMDQLWGTVVWHPTAIPSKHANAYLMNWVIKIWLVSLIHHNPYQSIIALQHKSAMKPLSLGWMGPQVHLSTWVNVGNKLGIDNSSLFTKQSSDIKLLQYPPKQNHGQNMIVHS